jgi:cell division protein FtsW (lipid II flippase)
MQRFWRQLAIATNWPVLGSVVLLSLLGVVSIWAKDPQYGKKQLLFMVVGLACMLVFQGVNYLRIGQFAWLFYFFSLALCIYIIMPGVPRSGFGSVPDVRHIHAWIDLGPLLLEPAELMKFALVGVLARYLRYRSNYRTLAGLLPPFALALVPLVLILKEPALGMAMLCVPTLFAILFIAGARKRHLLGIVAIALALMPVAWVCGKNVPGHGHVPLLMQPYQWDRVKALVFPDQELGYQQDRAILAFATGGGYGKGLGSIPLGQHVPEAQNDMIFALIGEQLGFFGSALLLLLYLVLFIAGVEIAARTREPFGRLLAFGIIAVLVGQTFLNLTVCVRLMPVTGITLPFISYGGSSLVASFMAVGLLLNVGKNRPLVMAKNSFEFGFADSD